MGRKNNSHDQYGYNNRGITILILEKEFCLKLVTGLSPHQPFYLRSRKRIPLPGHVPHVKQ